MAYHSNLIVKQYSNTVDKSKLPNYNITSSSPNPGL